MDAKLTEMQISFKEFESVSRLQVRFLSVWK